MIETVESRIQNRALKPAVENLKVVKAALGNKAGVVGAASMAQVSMREA